jgi:hypothetical protein
VYVISAYIVISTSNISINRTGRSHRRLSRSRYDP